MPRTVASMSQAPVELRSDTFTTPTPQMRRAMADADVGDDVWGEDPTAIALEEHCAGIFGKEAGLFVPSGTMGNEASIRVLTLAAVAREAGIGVFMDGARIFNASVACGVPVAAYAAEVDALSFCFSKGLGAPIGSMVVGPRGFVDDVRRARQLLGGGMRQVGVLCAAARVAIDTQVERLADDHANARRLAAGFADALPGSVDPPVVDTNMVFAAVGDRDVEAVVEAMAGEGVRVASVFPGTFRAVTHRDVSADGVERAISAFARAVA